jgi:quinoprotein glucose dehydrogenase
MRHEWVVGCEKVWSGSMSSVVASKIRRGKGESVRFSVALAMITAAVAASVHAMSGAPPVPAQAQGAKRSVWDGVYTDAQAKRGREAYEYSCATCHLPTLEGDESRDIPALYGDDFVEEWSGKPIKSLYELIRKMMPKDAPGSLKNETYADVVAYLLQSNEFPAGAQELTADPAALDRVSLDKVPPSR